ncbi:MAG: hypothetical protein KGL39_16485 [Patescibacteria group bacterium]|nr:hypothetical protein [Patescibacteria group bacterium]
MSELEDEYRAARELNKKSVDKERALRELLCRLADHTIQAADSRGDKTIPINYFKQLLMTFKMLGTTVDMLERIEAHFTEYLWKVTDLVSDVPEYIAGPVAKESLSFISEYVGACLDKDKALDALGVKRYEE